MPASPHARGWNAVVIGVRRADCPFAEDSDERQQWLTGFDAALAAEMEGDVTISPTPEEGLDDG